MCVQNLKLAALPVPDICQEGKRTGGEGGERERVSPALQSYFDLCRSGTWVCGYLGKAALPYHIRAHKNEQSYNVPGSVVVPGWRNGKDFGSRLLSTTTTTTTTTNNNKTIIKWTMLHIISSYHIVDLKRQNRLKAGTNKPKLKVKMQSVSVWSVGGVLISLSVAVEPVGG